LELVKNIPTKIEVMSQMVSLTMTWLGPS